MRPLRVPPRLREQLGNDASDDLTLLLQDTGTNWRDEVLTLATERFARLLAEETGRIRADMAGLECRLRTELAEFRATMREEQAAMRSEWRDGLAAVRVDVLRWSFLFWIGQLTAMVGLFAYFR